MSGTKVTEQVVNNFYRDMVDSHTPPQEALSQLRGFKKGVDFLSGFDQAGAAKIDSLIQHLLEDFPAVGIPGAPSPQIDLFRYF